MTKLSFVLFLSSILCTNAASLAQNVSLTRKEISFKEAFKEIKKQTGYNFLWAAENIKSTETIDITLVDVPLQEAIDRLLGGLPLTHQLKKETILIMEKEKPAVEKVRFSFIEEGKVQQMSVEGTVTDTAGGPLPGVSVRIKDTSTGVSTDSDGRYKIENIPQNSVLIFSFLGYKTEDVIWSGQTTLDIAMRQDLTGLDEVIVVGYGKQKRASVTGAVSTVNSEKLTVAPVANVTNTLAGRLPGLITKQQGGVPGSDNSSLNIRGFGSPLIIVDGIESSFANIDPNEIASISILKDASAAIYGARAGNGVILVTTKRGQEGKMNITFNTAMTLQAPTKLVKMASSGQMAELTRETHTNSGKPEETQRFTQEEVDLFYAGTDPDYPNTDWWDVVTRDYAPQQRHSLAVRGGSDRIKYYGFLGYTDQKTLFEENGGAYKRYNIRSNVDVQVTDDLTVQFDLTHIWENRDFPWRMANGNNAIWNEYWNSEPYYNPANPDGSLAYAGSGGSIGLHALSNSDHGGYIRSKNQNLIGSLAFNYDLNSLIRGLKAKAFVNTNQRDNFSKHWHYLPNSYTYNYSNDTYTQETAQTVPDLVHRDSRSHDLTGQFSLNYSDVFHEDHEVSALVLYEVIDEGSDWIEAGRGGYTSTAIEYLFNGGIGFQTSDGRSSEMGRQAFISRVNYGYKSKYLLEATFRIDQSAKFNKESRTGYFPSVSLGWRISEENFLNAGNFVNDLKLRLSYSETGQDDVGNFKYLAGYQAGDLYYIGSTPSAGLISTGLANPLLTWERMTIYNAGLDFSLFKGQLFGEVDAFWRNRGGIPGLRSSSLPSTFGAVLPTENLNSMNTRGFEISLGYKKNINDFVYTVNANLSYSRSKWDYYDEPEYKDPDQERRNKNTGQWADRRFGYLSEGLFTSQEEIDDLDYVYHETQGNAALAPGDIKYTDINKDGLLDWRDQVEIGKGAAPNWIGGLNFDLAYKGIDLNIFFQGGFGFTQKIVLEYGQNFSELMYRERWTPDNNRADGLIPRPGGAGSNNWNSDFYQKKSDYMRLKSLTLGYSFPQSLVEKVNIQGLRIYFAGTNLFAINGLNKYEIDPEAPNGESGHYYPQMRTFSLGLNLEL